MLTLNNMFSSIRRDWHGSGEVVSIVAVIVIFLAAELGELWMSMKQMPRD